ncbi:MAG: DUF3467 domain-containing protein [Undibacterium sp.]
MTEQKPQPIQIKANSTVLKGEYANMMQVMHTGEEFVLDFLSVYPPAGSLNARVIVSPSHMKRIVAALADNVAKYEAQFGVIKPSEAPTMAPIGFDAQ